MEPIRVQGRTLTSDDLTALRALISQNPDWNRTRLSVHLCELWNWRNAAGRLKDMAARTLLLKLQARGLIELPAPRTSTRRPRCQPTRAATQGTLPLSMSPIESALQSLQPLRLELAYTVAVRQRIRHLLAEHHYRGFNGAVGENVQYLFRDREGRELAVMVFGAAAWKVAQRDRFIGWSAAQRQRTLDRIANQQRFLILPWVRVPHLASHLLALARRRLSADWQVRYGHPIWLVETFVESPRFAGTAYRAAGWICAGQTTGRTRQDRQRQIQTAVKTIWLLPLHRRFRQHLTPV
jgi:hypothetical protein